MSEKYIADKEELTEVLSLANSRVTKNVEILTADDLKQNVAYHIALDKRPKLYPNISKRAGHSEDNTLPRIHVSMNLMGCWFGYAGGGDLATNYIPDTTKKKVATNTAKNSPYKGGFYIHEIPFRCALKPNKELVYDTDFTDEFWLITYNEYTKIYPANIIGILFTNKVTYVPRTGKTPIEITSLCVKIEKGKRFKLSLNNEYIKPNKKHPEYLTEGCWMFDISDSFTNVQNLKRISENDFNDNKLHSAGMLSRE